MQYFPEYGCEQCGNRILKPTPKPAAPSGPTPKPGNQCDQCGHITYVPKMRGFQCTMQLRSYLYRLLSSEELNELRLNPEGFVKILNQKLKSAGKTAIKVDLGTNPPTLFEEGE